MQYQRKLLKELDIICITHITNIPESVGNLESLKELYIYNSGLVEIPESITKLKSLITLNLGGNKLTAL
ncbi:MAG: hypothetical protein KAU21_04780, partial [Gammaproteobacteria bacterium]|nr:hypothetical protein [Gammaproteobacteria bacterium]